MKRALLVTGLLIVACGIYIFQSQKYNRSRQVLSDSKRDVVEAQVNSYIATDAYYSGSESGNLPNTVMTLNFNNKAYCDDAGDEPVIIAEMFVLAKLKAPSTAEFAASSISTRTKPCNYRVNGSVDSQNGFGAMIRTDFSFSILFDPELKQWRNLEVTMQ